MKTQSTALSKQLLNRLYPLNRVPASSLEALNEHVLITTFSPYQNIIKYSERSHLYHYLIDGNADVRLSFENRHKISAEDAISRYPLEKEISGGGMVRAITPCKILIVNQDFLSEFIIRDDTSDHHIVNVLQNSNPRENLMQDNLQKNSDLIDGSYKVEWAENFYQSTLATHLTASNIQRIFSSLDNFDVNRGREIVKCHTQGDYFYIIKEGFAEVITDVAGMYKGRRFELGPGDYFGDEALVAQTVRNASVIMISDGVVGRMGKKLFEEVIKQSLVVVPTKDEFLGLTKPIFCDVRLPIEYKCGHRQNCINIPIASIRQKLAEFDPYQCYVITPEGGRRSELAVYLMRQAGLKAFYMDDALAAAVSTQVDDSQIANG